jgi:hypothetical protein
VPGDPAKVTRYISTVIQGLAGQAKGGYDRPTLQHVVEVCLEGMGTRGHGSERAILSGSQNDS